MPNDDITESLSAGKRNLQRPMACRIRPLVPDLAPRFVSNRVTN